MKQIAASIMCGDPLNVEQELYDLKEAGIKWLHCDVMDGVFVDNLAMAPYNLAPIINKQEFTVDIHLATQSPEKYIEMFIPLKPNYLTFHIETSNNPIELIEKIKKSGIKVGIAISPKTELSVIIPYLVYIDLVLVMTVNPGFAGQAFQLHILDKLKYLNEEISHLTIKPLIEVDGNIYSETIKKIHPIGADLYVLGTTALFNKKEGSYQDKVKAINQLIL